MTDPVENLSLRHRLRAIPVFPEIFPQFPDSDWPEDPVEVFIEWLDTALRHRVLEPHAATLSTANARGEVSARTLILKDIVDGGWRFASHDETRKAEDIEENSHGALTFYWPELGRQVLVRGTVEELGPEVSAEDYRQRPLAGTEVDPHWKAYALKATHVEFWQASPDRNHHRVLYRREGEGSAFVLETEESKM